MTIQNSSNQTRNPPEHEHRMAKGTLYLMIAQVIVLGSGYIIHFGLARMVSVEDYGRFGVILSILTLTQIFLLMGIPEAVSKYIAEGRDSKIVTRKASKLQFIFSLIFFFGLLLLAPYIAEILHDDKLTNYLRFVSFIIPLRAMFSIDQGVLNGFRAFGKSAIGQTITAILKIIFVFAFVYLGFELFGVIGGYILSSFVGLIVLIILAKNRSQKGNSVSNSDLVNFSYPVIIFAFCFSFIGVSDLLFVKALIENNDYAGYYTSARTMATIFSVASVGLSFSILPSISKSYKNNDVVLTKSYIRNSFRYALMISIPAAFVVSATSSELLSLLFGSEYSKAGAALSILVFGWLFIQLFTIMVYIINGSGKTRIPMYIVLLLTPISIALNYYLIPIFDLVGAALALSFTIVIGLIIAAFYVYKIFEELVYVKSIVKIVLSSLLILIITFFMDFNGLLLIAEYLFLFGIYFGLLYLMREFTKEDSKLFLSILSSKR